MKETSTARILDFEENFNWMQEQARYTNLRHGFGDIDENVLAVPTRLGLIMTEVAEALEAHRSGDDAHIGEELADIVIRTMDLAAYLEINLGVEIVDKASKNKTRDFRHGGKRY